MLITLKKWRVLRNKLNYTHTNIGAKVEPREPSVLIVYPTQMLKHLRFYWDCGVCGNNSESIIEQHKLVISMIKLLQKAIITYHCLQWHVVFYACKDYMRS